MDEAFDAVCLKDAVCNYVLKDLLLEEICFDDHRVSPFLFQCTEMKAASSMIIRSFLGKDSLRMVLLSSLLAVTGLGPCGGRVILGAWI